MTAMRFAGTRLLDRFGRVPVLRLCAGLALVGLVVFALAPSLPLAVVAIVLWGFGAALGFPVGMSAASDDPARSAARVSVVSIDRVRRVPRRAAGPGHARRPCRLPDGAADDRRPAGPQPDPEPRRRAAARRTGRHGAGAARLTRRPRTHGRRTPQTPAWPAAAARGHDRGMTPSPSDPRRLPHRQPRASGPRRSSPACRLADRIRLVSGRDFWTTEADRGTGPLGDAHRRPPRAAQAGRRLRPRRAQRLRARHVLPGGRDPGLHLGPRPARGGRGRAGSRGAGGGRRGPARPRAEPQAAPPRRAQLRVLLRGPVPVRHDGRRPGARDPVRGGGRLPEALRGEQPGDRPDGHRHDRRRAHPARAVPARLRDRGRDVRPG